MNYERSNVNERNINIFKIRVSDFSWYLIKIRRYVGGKV